MKTDSINHGIKNALETTTMVSKKKLFSILCSHLADRFDLNQAGGGNGSAKEGDLMLIKASGCLLSEVTEETGYTEVVTEEVRHALQGYRDGILDETGAWQRITAANRGKLRPSIETYLHALLPATYVLHLHGAAALLYASSPGFIESLMAQERGHFQRGRLLVDYAKPGIALAVRMQDALCAYKNFFGIDPSCLLLRNHGILCAGEDTDTLFQSIEDISLALAQEMSLPTERFAPYRRQTELKEALQRNFSGEPRCMLLCEDEEVNAYLRAGLPLATTPAFPDAVVYCGMSPVELASADDMSPILSYLRHYGELPKLFFYHNRLYAAGDSLKKCRETLEVFKIQAFLQSELGDRMRPLTKGQAEELLSWEAEKYRRAQ